MYTVCLVDLSQDWEKNGKNTCAKMWNTLSKDVFGKQNCRYFLSDSFVIKFRFKDGRTSWWIVMFDTSLITQQHMYTVCHVDLSQGDNKNRENTCPKMWNTCPKMCLVNKTADVS